MFSGVADVSFAVDKDLIGSSESQVEGDELDNAADKDTKVEGTSKADIKTEDAVTSVDSVSDGSGIGLLSKMVFFLVICGAILAFLKTRKSPGMGDKSLA